MEGLVFASVERQWLSTFGLSSRDAVTLHGICLRQRDNILKAWKVDSSQITAFCCHEVLVGGTAEVQVRDTCTVTTILFVDAFCVLSTVDGTGIQR